MLQLPTPPPPPSRSALRSFAGTPADAFAAMAGLARLAAEEECARHEHAPEAVPDGKVDVSPPKAAADELAAWLARIQRRDESGMRLLYRACRRRVFVCALGVVKQEHLANEVVSATFMQVWTNATHYDATRGSVLAWLMILTRSRALDALRRVKTLRQFETSIDDEDEDGSPIAERQGEPLAHSEQRCRRTNLQRAMLRLPAVQRQVLMLTAMGGMSQDEAAGHLHMPLGTIKSHARRGMLSLRHHCEALGLTAD